MVEKLDYSRMIPSDSKQLMSPDEVQWRMEKSKVFHSEYDPNFDNTHMRFLFRKVLKADIPVHTQKNHFDKRFMVKPPPDKAHLLYKRKL